MNIIATTGKENIYATLNDSDRTVSIYNSAGETTQAIIIKPK